MNINEYNIAQLVRPLLDWFYGHARILPWREEPTPYRVWVSEIMLQQTRVEAVKPYFERFVSTLPDVRALAECPEEDLLKLWEGLGYYNRVRNMQIAAREIMEQYGGELPASYESLLKLKGIGHYTAGAVSSIAYGIPMPAVDGNVLRVISRVAADDGDIMKQSVKNNMEQVLEQVMPEQEAGAFNQALMELGATVCLPNGAPKCEQCPWNEVCLAKKEDRISELPVKKKAPKRKIEQRTILLIRDGDRIILRKRPKKGLLAGMYEFPNELGQMEEKEAVAYARGLGLEPVRVEKLADAKHIFSHVEWRMCGYMIRVSALAEEDKELIFAEAEDFKRKYPMPSAFSAYTEYMNIRQGKDNI